MKIGYTSHNDSGDSVTVSDRLTAVSINLFSVTKNIRHHRKCPNLIEIRLPKKF
jgi:hypothetical protein